VTDAGLKELAGLKSLRALNISHTEVTDKSLKVLAGLNVLKELVVNPYTKLSEQGLEELQKALPDCYIGRHRRRTDGRNPP
jgi:hypothetical protein